MDSKKVERIEEYLSKIDVYPQNVRKVSERIMQIVDEEDILEREKRWEMEQERGYTNV